MTLDQIIDKFTESAPDGWQAVLTVENGWGCVEAVRPDGTRVVMDDGESCLVEQVQNVLDLAEHERLADEIAAKEANDQSQFSAERR